MAEQDASGTGGAWPREGEVSRWTDAYLNRTRTTVEAFGDCVVTYAVFMRRPVVCAPRLMVEWLAAMGRARGAAIEVELMHGEGQWVGAGEPVAYITGPFSALVDLETLFLQKLGPACVAAPQRLHHVRRSAANGLPRHGRQTLRRHRNGGDDGLRRVRRLGAGAAQGRRARLHRQRHGRDGALFRQREGAGHHAPCADRLCRRHRARGRIVPPGQSRRAAHRAGGLFRP